VEPLLSLLLLCSQLNATVVSISNNLALQKALIANFDYYSTLQRACAWARGTYELLEEMNATRSRIKEVLERPLGFGTAVKLASLVGEYEVKVRQLNCTVPGLKEALRELEGVQAYLCATKPENPYLWSLCTLSEYVLKARAYGKEALSELEALLPKLYQDLNYFQSALKGCWVVKR